MNYIKGHFHEAATQNGDARYRDAKWGQLLIAGLIRFGALIREVPGQVRRQAGLLRQAGREDARRVSGRPTAHPKLPEDLPANAWQPPENVLDKIPEELGRGKVNDGGTGYRWFDKHADTYIRITRGNPKADHSHQQVDYVHVTRRGQVIGKDGKPILESAEIRKPANHPDAHIPLSDWIKWKDAVKP